MIAQTQLKAQKALAAPPPQPRLTHQRARTLAPKDSDLDSLRARAHFTWRITGGRDGAERCIPCRMAAWLANPMNWALSQAQRPRN